MKKIIVILGLILLTGCSKKDTLIGTWKTNYNVSGIGSVVEKYSFENKGKCKRIIITTTQITNNCTYEFNKNKTKIKIDWSDKLYKNEFNDYKEINKDKIQIGLNTYTREDVKYEK